MRIAMSFVVRDIVDDKDGEMLVLSKPAAPGAGLDKLLSLGKIAVVEKTKPSKRVPLQTAPVLIVPNEGEMEVLLDSSPDIGDVIHIFGRGAYEVVGLAKRGIYADKIGAKTKWRDIGFGVRWGLESAG